MILPRPRHDRVVEPELLDILPPASPDAIRSRRDLRLINTLMGNGRWIERQVRDLAAACPGRPWWELGAGDGDLGARLADRLGVGDLHLTGLDLAPRSRRWPAAWGWRQADILEVAKQSPPADAIIANLILHHFEPSGLALIGQWICRAQTIIAVEPLRARFPHALAYAMRLADINHVTREDIHTSIRAGFRGQELPEALGLHPPDWDVQVQHTLLGAYRMVARRRTTSPEDR